MLSVAFLDIYGSTAVEGGECGSGYLERIGWVGESLVQLMRHLSFFFFLILLLHILICFFKNR